MNVNKQKYRHLVFNIGFLFFLYSFLCCFDVCGGDSLLLIIRGGHCNLFKKKEPVVF